MRMSQLFSVTLRNAPAEAEIASHQLLLRGGYVRQLASGVFSTLPLAYRVLVKIKNIIREEMDAIAGQEMLMPVVHPGDIWKETNRWYEIGAEMSRFQDRNGRDMALAMTHEEVVTELVRKEIKSYKQLPALVYQIQTKWRDEPRPRAGVIRTREFTMKDSYSLDSDEAGLDQQYRAHYQAYFNMFHRCGLPVIAVASDTGMMGGKLAHEFMYITPIGEDTLMICDECGYAANREIARFIKPSAEPEEALPIEKVATPDTKTIEGLANFLNIPECKTAKAVFMVATVTEEQEDVEKFVFAVVRGDMELNELKLGNAVKAKVLRPADDAEIRAIGAVAGYGSPIGIQDCIIVVDDAVAHSPNLVSGANEEGYHLLNVNYERDYKAQVVTDIAMAKDGDACPNCSHGLKVVRGVETGNIFKLGTRYSAAMGATYLDKNGKAQPVIMGSYGIGVERLMACIAENYHDDYGLMWPISVAPYQVHLVLLPDDESQQIADKLYVDLRAAGIDVLYDDRNERAGVKFNDADLIGIPLRLTVSKRSLTDNGVEYKRRDQKDQAVIAIDEVIDHVKQEITHLQTIIDTMVVDVPYKE